MQFLCLSSYQVFYVTFHCPVILKQLEKVSVQTLLKGSVPRDRYLSEALSVFFHGWPFFHLLFYVLHSYLCYYTTIQYVQYRIKYQVFSMTHSMFGVANKTESKTVKKPFKHWVLWCFYLMCREKKWIQTEKQKKWKILQFITKFEHQIFEIELVVAI